MSGSDPTVTLDEVIAESESAWMHFMELVERAPLDRIDSPGVCGDWSLKIVAGHVGYWDGVEADFFALAARPQDLDWQPLNDANALANRDRSFAEIVAEARTNHRRMMEAIAANASSLDPVQVRELTCDHYVEHGGQIEAWLAAIGEHPAGIFHEELGYNAAEPVNDLLPRIDASWERLQEVLSRVPEHRIDEPGVCDRWSVKDLIGHIAFWDSQVVDDIDGYVAGHPPLKNPWNDWNATEAAKRAESSVDAVRAELASAHQRMLDRLRGVGGIDAEMIAVDTWEHYDEHSREIERWLAETQS